MKKKSMKKTIITIPALALLFIGMILVSCEKSVTTVESVSNNSEVTTQNQVLEDACLSDDYLSNKYTTAEDNHLAVETEMKESQKDEFAVVHFDGNGGQGYIGNITVKVGTTITLPNNGFTRPLYRLVGFARTPESTSPEFSLGACFTASESATITLYAVYEDNSATVTICKNDADMFGEEQRFLVEKGSDYRIPEGPFSKDYYIFAGYSKNPTAVTAEYAVGDYIYVTNDINFYPVFTPITYKLIIEPQNGDARVEYELPYGDVNLNEFSTLFTKVGHSLVGFSTSADSEDVIFQIDDTLTLNCDRVLYALYEPVPIQISFITDGEFSIDTIYCKYGETVTLPEPAYTKPYYEFSGYSLEGLDSNYIKYHSGEEITPATDLVLYPIYSLKTSVQRNLIKTTKVTDDGLLFKVDFSELVDVSELYEAGYSSYRVTVEWNTSKIKGKCDADFELFRAMPKTNYNVWDINGNRPNQFKDSYRILNKNNFSVGQFYTISTSYRPTDELLSETAFYVYYLATGANIFDVINNSYNLTEFIVTIDFFK